MSLVATEDNVKEIVELGEDERDLRTTSRCKKQIRLYYFRYHTWKVEGETRTH